MHPHSIKSHKQLFMLIETVSEHNLHIYDCIKQITTVEDDEAQ